VAIDETDPSLRCGHADHPIISDDAPITIVLVGRDIVAGRSYRVTGRG
jgi:hypothetical protein